jgi:type I restriction-modification system DNA methylase subunit
VVEWSHFWTERTFVYPVPGVGLSVPEALRETVRADSGIDSTSSSKRIEDEWNAKLRAALAGRLKTAVEARKWDIPGPNKPDGAWTFQRDGLTRLAIFSGKMGARQIDQAINTAGDYQRNLAQVDEVEEAFGVTFPEKGNEFHLYALTSKAHPFHSYTLTSIEAVGAAIEGVIGRKEPEPEQPETLMIRLLRSSVERISRAFSRESIKQLTEVLGIDSPLMASVVMTAGQGPVSEAQARTAASYILVNQVLFYHILSSHVELGLVRLDPDGFDPRALRPQYFAKVLEIDYKPIFEYDIAQHLRAEDGFPALRGLVRAFEAIQASQISNDVIGKVFHNLIPRPKRKPLGAFYTNSNAAHLLARLTIDRVYDRVIDPACGSGTMLVAAYESKKELYERGGRKLDSGIHEKFVGEQVTGVDIMVFSAHLAVVNLSLQAPEYKLEKVRIAIEDSLHLQIDRPVESSRTRLQRASRPGYRRIDAYTEDGTLRVEEGGIGGQFDIGVGKVDAVLMNPPFSDSDRIPDEYKAGLLTRFSSERLKGLLQGKYSLQLPFLLLSDELLADNGRIGAVLPITTFTGEAFGKWVDFIVNNYTVRAVVIGVGRTAFSENTQLTECLFVAEKTPPQVERRNRFVLLATEMSPTQWDQAMIRSMADAVLQKREETVAGIFTTKVFEQDRLSPAIEGLQSLVQKVQAGWAAINEELDLILRTSTVTFKELEANADMSFGVGPLSSKEQEGPHGRGREFYCVSALSYFLDADRQTKKDDRFNVIEADNTRLVVQDSVTGESFEVPLDHLVPLCRRIAGLRKIDFSGEIDFIAAEWFRSLDKLIRRVVETDPQLAAAAGAGDPVQVFTNRIKNRWPEKVKEGRARALMSRRVNLGAPGTSLIAAYSASNPMVAGDYWLISAPEPQVWVEKAMVLWLNSSLFLAQLLSFRTETQGTWSRLDKHRMLTSRIPDFSSFTPIQVESLERLFDSLKDEEFPSLMDQLEEFSRGRLAIDTFFVELLSPGLTGPKRTSFLSRLYAAILDQLNQLKKGM